MILVKVQKGTMKLTSCWTIFFTLYISRLACSLPVNELEQAQKLLQHTLKALRGALDFFNAEYKEVNLDAVVGTRIVAGEFHLFIYLKVRLIIARAFFLKYVKVPPYTKGLINIFLRRISTY